MPCKKTLADILPGNIFDSKAPVLILAYNSHETFARGDAFKVRNNFPEFRSSLNQYDSKIGYESKIINFEKEGQKIYLISIYRKHQIGKNVNYYADLELLKSSLKSLSFDLLDNGIKKVATSQFDAPNKNSLLSQRYYNNLDAKDVRNTIESTLGELGIETHIYIE